MGLGVGFMSCNENDKDKTGPVSPAHHEYAKVKLIDLKGQSINLNNYSGKTIFINFWATWCRPCIEEMPSILNAQNILRNENIIFLLASSESLEEIEAFKNACTYKLNFTRIENSEELGIQSLPATFIFNAGGKLVFSETGLRKWDDNNNINLIRKFDNKND